MMLGLDFAAALAVPALPEVLEVSAQPQPSATSVTTVNNSFILGLDILTEGNEENEDGANKSFILPVRRFGLGKSNTLVAI